MTDISIFPFLSIQVSSKIAKHRFIGKGSLKFQLDYGRSCMNFQPAFVAWLPSYIGPCGLYNSFQDDFVYKKFLGHTFHKPWLRWLAPFKLALILFYIKTAQIMKIITIHAWITQFYGFTSYISQVRTFRYFHSLSILVENFS